MAGIKNINELSELTSEAKSDIKRMLDINEQGGGGSDSGDNNSPWESGTGENSAKLKNTQSAANGIGSVAIGNNCWASGNYSYVEGYGSLASGDYSHAEGFSSANAEYAHSEGGDSGAWAIASHAEGSSIALAGYSHSENFGHAGLDVHDGSNNGMAMHAEGDSFAYGSLSHSEGERTIASGKATHCGGRYNIDLNESVMYQPDSYGDYAEIIGNGTNYNSCSNARTLTWEGVEWTQGGFETDGNLTLGKGTGYEVTLTAEDLNALLALIKN